MESEYASVSACSTARTNGLAYPHCSSRDRQRQNKGRGLQVRKVVFETDGRRNMISSLSFDRLGSVEEAGI